jgi:hypothetical protein
MEDPRHLKRRVTTPKGMQTAIKVKNSIINTAVRSIRRIVKLNHVSSMVNYLAGEYELVEGPLNYNADGLACSTNCDFLNDERFIKAYELGKSTGSWGDYDVRWRAYVACWAAAHVKTLAGDFVECGVNRGGLSRTVIDYVDFPSLPKKFYLLDTFQGLSAACISDAEKKRGIEPGGYEECYEAVVESFKGFNVEIVRGVVPETLAMVRTGQVCYLSIDMNCAGPEIAAAEFFWDKLVSGAVIVLDDYGRGDRYYEQKVAFDHFAAAKSVQILSLPTGQGLIFKP